MIKDKKAKEARALEWKAFRSLSPLSYRILLALSQKPMHAAAVARELRSYEQKVYYHIKKLEKDGFLKVMEKKKIRGGIANIYELCSHSFVLDLPGKEEKVLQVRRMPNKLRHFFHPFVEENKLNCIFVVGSPDPHGPFQTRARDAHYATQLALFLGQYVEFPGQFAIRLDVDIKAERLMGENMILIGGPGVNVVTFDVNESFPIRIEVTKAQHGFSFGGLYSSFTHRIYTEDVAGVIEKIRNPFDKEKFILLLAGNKAIGTKACILAITRFWKKVLDKYEKEDEWGCVVRGLDMDGDGKIDAISVLEP